MTIQASEETGLCCGTMLRMPGTTWGGPKTPIREPVQDEHGRTYAPNTLYVAHRSRYTTLATLDFRCVDDHWT